jgi:hypothetical protein
MAKIIEVIRLGASIRFLVSRRIGGLKDSRVASIYFGCCSDCLRLPVVYLGKIDNEHTLHEERHERNDNLQGQ